MEAVFLETSEVSVDDDSFQIKVEPEEDPLTDMESKPKEEEADSFIQVQVKSELDIKVEEAHEAKKEEAFGRDDKLEGLRMMAEMEMEDKCEVCGEICTCESNQNIFNRGSQAQNT